MTIVLMALHNNSVSRAHRLNHRFTDNEIVSELEYEAMKTTEISFYEWQQRYKTEKTCLEQLA